MIALESNPQLVKLVEAWGRSLSQILSQAGSVSPKVETIDAKSCTEVIAQMRQKRYRATLRGCGSIRGILTLVTSEPEAVQLGQALLSEPANRSAELSERYRNAVKELIRQAAEQISASWASKAGGKLEISADSGGAQPEATCGGLRLGGDKFPGVTIVLLPSAEFVDALRTLEGSADLPRASASRSHQAPEVGSGDPIPSNTNLDLLFDVQLEATIRFGKRQLLLRDILSMGPGSVVELECQINEPADLLVAGRLVARGEVVVVNGNFGLRVTELSSASQRATMLQA